MPALPTVAKEFGAPGSSSTRGFVAASLPRHSGVKPPLLELKRELFGMLSGAVARQIKKEGITEEEILADFGHWRKER
jgi:hypothetical protein